MKKFLRIVGILVVIVVLAGVWGYNQFLKPDPAVQQQLVDQFGEDFFSFVDIESVNDASSEDGELTVEEPRQEHTNEGTKVDNSKVKTPGTEVSSHTVVNSNTTPPPSDKGTTAPEPEPITIEKINSKYVTQFTHLQNLAVSRLDTLFSSAVEEYQQSKKDGKVSRSQLAQKYLQAGTTLEANVDSQFYGALSKLELELKENNLATDIVKVYKERYENAKSEKRSQLFAKVRQ